MPPGELLRPHLDASHDACNAQVGPRLLARQHCGSTQAPREVGHVQGWEGDQQDGQPCGRVCLCLVVQQAHQHDHRQQVCVQRRTTQQGQSKLQFRSAVGHLSRL